MLTITPKRKALSPCTGDTAARGPPEILSTAPTASTNLEMLGGRFFLGGCGPLPRCSGMPFRCNVFVVLICPCCWWGEAKTTTRYIHHHPARTSTSSVPVTHTHTHTHPAGLASRILPQTESTKPTARVLMLLLLLKPELTRILLRRRIQPGLGYSGFGHSGLACRSWASHAWGNDALFACVAAITLRAYLCCV